MDQDTILKQPHTVCKECCWASYDGNTQTGCNLGIDNKLVAKGAKLIEACDSVKNFNILVGRVCPFHNQKDVTTVRLTYDAIITNGEPEDILKTLRSIKGQFPKPKKVIVLVDSPEKVNSILGPVDGILRESNIRWEVRETEWDFELGHSPYFAKIKAGRVLEDDFMSRINKFLYDELNIFSIITASDVLVSVTKLYERIGEPFVANIRSAEKINRIIDFEKLSEEQPPVEPVLDA